MGESVSCSGTMRILLHLHLLLLFNIIQFSLCGKNGRQLSLFSIVQFPNQECTSESSTTQKGTCVTTSECTTMTGTADGKCASGFGVCCVIATSTCGSTISTNIPYIRNPASPSGNKPSSASTCSFTINKVSEDVCQLRLDFQTFSVFVVDTTSAACTDSFAVTGQTGKNPPTICGTNTGYHMYAEFGALATDSAQITLTYGTAGISTEETFNILARQISCTATWRAPTDCVQYFTGASGNVKNYNFGQLLLGQYYTNCIRTEKGRCGILWKTSSTTSPDPFLIAAPGTTAANAGTNPGNECPTGFVHIPGLSMDGINAIPVPLGLQAFQSFMCGTIWGVEGQTTAASLVSRVQPFTVGVYSHATTAQPAATSTGFSLDYTQLPC